MKRYLALTLAALALVLAAPSAFAVKVRGVDATPPVDCTGNGVNTACSIIDPNDTYIMNFVPATSGICEAAKYTPGVAAGDLNGFTWCTVLVNFSQSALTSLDFTFTVPEQGMHDDYNTVTCDGIPAGLSASFCPPASLAAPLTAGDSFNVSFSAFPGVPVGQAAYLFVDFTNTPGTTSLRFSPLSVPEPGELGLFGLGLLGIGVGYGWRRRRQTSRGNEAT
ncbi:MAG: PEP-CTERM sorting domain-containing protein [Rhodanobacter sp.]